MTTTTKLNAWLQTAVAEVPVVHGAQWTANVVEAFRAAGAADACHSEIDKSGYDMFVVVGQTGAAFLVAVTRFEGKTSANISQALNDAAEVLSPCPF